MGKKKKKKEIKIPESLNERWKPPYLIQRIIKKDKESGQQGIDSVFRFDYMGSAEFEFGALPKALRSMRLASKYIDPEPIRIKTEHGNLWYVGIADNEIIDFTKDLIVDQMTLGKMRLKERTKMRDSLSEGDNGHFSPDGWWAIDQPVPWVLFIKKEDAKIWISKL